MAFQQAIQVVYCPSLQLTVTTGASKDIRFRLERCLDGYFFDPSDSTFKPLGSISDPLIPLNENPSGTYTYVLDVSGFVDGTYKTHTVEIFSGSEVSLYLDQPIFLVGSNPLEHLGLDLELVNENTGGTNNLCYITAGGDPVDGADILAFTLADFIAGNTENAVAVSKTGPDGNFLYPILLQRGQTYVIVFQKPGQYGPDNTQITI